VRTLPEILAHLKIDPAAVSFVAITQVVSYHTGGIDAELFPNATFYLAREGVLELLVDPPGHPAPEFYFTAPAWASLRTLAIEGRLRLVAEAEQIVPGVDFEVTGGHHPGSAAVLVCTSAGLVAVLETAFVRRNLETGSPIGIAEDAAAAREAMRRMSARADVVVAIHDAENGSAFPG
jgi:glyoxylase-like metal-dependent hydrolase (beta-lactamase superfamily II)